MFDLPRPNITESIVSDIEPLPMAYSYSDTQFEILSKHIKAFEKTLDSEHDSATCSAVLPVRPKFLRLLIL
ncbi:MAG: hypothetical protein HFH51_15770 [Lachnospiraceae bacterium]|nr:hypothetical protein [Lachnospiraceae bacterium]